MTSPRSPAGQPLLASLLRGFLAALANPGVVVAPFLLGVATLLAVALSLLALALPLGFAFLRDAGSLWQKDPEELALAASQALAELASAPLLLAVSFAIVLALATLVLLLASYLKAGLTGVLLASLRAAPAKASVRAFRVDVTSIFFASAHRHVVPFFWLLNLYGLGVTLSVSVFLVGLAAFVVRLIESSAGGGPPAGIALGVALMLVGIPFLVVGIATSQIVTFAASREIVAGDLPFLKGVAAGLARLRGTAGRSAVLYLLLIAAGVAVAGVFGAPRLFLGVLASGPAALSFASIAMEVVLVFVQSVVFYFLQVVTAAAFTALWTEPARGGDGTVIPPVAFHPVHNPASSAPHVTLAPAEAQAPLSALDVQPATPDGDAT